MILAQKDVKLCKIFNMTTKIHDNTMQHTHLDITHSTNSQLIAWLIDNFDNQPNANICHKIPQLLTADSQTKGRGQHHRTWQSPKGNVYFSLYIPVKKISKSDFVNTPIDGRLSLCVSLHLLKMPIIQSFNQILNRLQQPTIGLKWVNDLGFYQNSVFQKLAGILIEPVLVKGEMLGVVVGIGLNVFNTPVLTTKTQENLNYQAISLLSLHSQLQHICHDLPIIPELSQIYEQMTTACLQAILQFNSFDYQNRNHLKNIDNFLNEYGQVDVLKGKNICVNLPTGEQIQGQAGGIDNNGCLLLKTNSQTKYIWTGTIAIDKETYEGKL